MKMPRVLANLSVDPPRGGFPQMVGTSPEPSSNVDPRLINCSCIDRGRPWF